MSSIEHSSMQVDEVIKALKEDNLRLRQQVQELEQEIKFLEGEKHRALHLLAESQAREAKLRDMLEFVLNTHFCTGDDGDLAREDALHFLAQPKDNTALKEYRKRVLFTAAEWFDNTGYKSLVPAELRRMAEEGR